MPTSELDIWKLLSISQTDGVGNPLQDVVASVAFFFLLRWAEHQERQEAAVAEFEGREFSPQIPSELGWQRIREIFRFGDRRLDERQILADRILPALCHIGGSPLADMIAQAAYCYDPRKLSWNLLRAAVEYVDSWAIETPAGRSDAGDIFSQFIDEAADKTRYSGEFFTPENIAQLMVEIAAPKAGETVYDPCFGLGGLLEQAGMTILDDAQGVSASKWANIVNNTLYGVEISPTAYLIGLTRTILNEFDNPRLRLGNALEEDFNNSPQFDVILAAPPIGAHSSNRRLYRHFPIKAHSLENFFMQHIMASLKPNGRAVVALPEGFLFRGGADEKVRERLLTEFAVEGVISLPEGSMIPHTSVKANLIVFRKAEPVTDIWFQEIRPTKRGTSKTPPVFDVALEAEKFRERSENTLLDWKQSVVQIADRNFELAVRRKANQLDNLIKRLHKKEPSLKVVKLGDIAEIIGGIGYTRRDVFPQDEISGNEIPLIRVTELGKDGKIKPASLFFSEDTIGKVSYSNKRLLTGDIVVSTQGTIGKVGRVDGFNDGAIPAHGITTIRLKSAEVQPLYLMRLLQSQPLQEWLEAHANGVTVKNIPLREIESLPIPILDDDIQKYIAGNIKSNAHTLELLKVFENKIHYESTANFLSHPQIKNIIADGFDEKDGSMQLDILNTLLLSEIGFRAEKLINGSLEKWFASLLSVTEKLTDALHLSSGMERLALIEFCANDSKQTFDNLRSVNFDELTKESLLTLVEKVREMIDYERESLLIYTPISASFETSIFEAKPESTEVTLIIKNEGKTLLRNVQITDSWEMKNYPVGLLSAGQEVRLNFSVPPQPPDLYTITFYWKGLRIDDEPVSGETEISFRYVEQNQAELSGFAENPYVVGTSIDSNENSEMFFGRADVIGRIRRSLRAKGSSTVLLLEGNRRIGKTSILKRLLVPDALPEWIPVYFNTQGGDGNQGSVGLSANEIFYGITREIILTLHAVGIEFEAVELGTISKDLPRLELRKLLRTKLREAFETKSPFELLDIQIDSLKNFLGSKRIVLLLDEFDKIDEGIKTGATNPIVPENIRNLFHTHNHISGVLTGARRIKSLREDHWSALYGIGVSITVDALDKQAARQLVSEPVKNQLIFSDSVRDYLIEMAGLMPFLIQSLCYYVFEICYEKGEHNVTLDIVEAAAEKMTEDNEHFKTLFDFIGNNRSRFIVFLVNNLSKNPDRVTSDLIAEHLEKNDIDYSISDLADDLKHLLELDVLKFDDGSYNIKIPLMSKWLEKVDGVIFRRQAAEE